MKLLEQVSSFYSEFNSDNFKKCPDDAKHGESYETSNQDIVNLTTKLFECSCNVIYCFQSVVTHCVMCTIFLRVVDQCYEYTRCNEIICMILLTFDVLAELIRISSIFRPFFGLIRPGKKVVSASRINQAESTWPNLPGRINMDSLNSFKNISFGARRLSQCFLRGNEKSSNNL